MGKRDTRVATLVGALACIGAWTGPAPLQGPAAVPAAAVEATPDSVLLDLYEGGIPFDEFLSNARRRVSQWNDNYAAAEVDADLLGRARAVPGTWRFLAVAEDWCGDSVNTIPYLARLVDLVDGLDMRVVNSRVGRQVMEEHPTPDGRAATPTVILLDSDGDKAGCFVERPTPLQEWFLDNPDNLDEDALYDAKYAWYDEDRGRETLAQIIGSLEAAASGNARCELPTR